MISEGAPPSETGWKMIKKLYDWTMSLAASRHAPLALGAIAFAESSFFPVPPDVILLPMSLAEPKRSWLYAAICTVASTAAASGATTGLA